MGLDGAVSLGASGHILPTPKVELGKILGKG